MIHSSSSTKRDRKSTRLNSSHVEISYAVFCLKKKNSYFLRYTCTTITTSYAYLNPMVAVGLSVVLANERLKSLEVVSILISFIFFLLARLPQKSTLFPYTTLFR